MIGVGVPWSSSGGGDGGKGINSGGGSGRTVGDGETEADTVGVLWSEASPIAKDARNLSSSRRLAGRSGVPGVCGLLEVLGGVPTRGGADVLRTLVEGRS